MANTQIRTKNERKQNIRVVVIVSRKERRERGVLISILFTLALEWSQVSLRLENAEAEGSQMKQLFQFNGVISRSALRSLVVRSQRPL